MLYLRFFLDKYDIYIYIHVSYCIYMYILYLSNQVDGIDGIMETFQSSA